MKYSISGFPRIGAKRELKFITESYFRGDVSLEDLTKVVKEQRAVQWKVQQAAGQVSFHPMTIPYTMVCWIQLSR